MSQDDVERVARALWKAHFEYYKLEPRPFESQPTSGQELWRFAARAALSAMPQRVFPELIAKLNALASRLTQMGEYEAVDLIDTVMARVTAMPGRELLAEALEALEPFAVGARSIDVDPPGDHQPSHGRGSVTAGDLRRARAAADKIRAAMGGQ